MVLHRVILLLFLSDFLYYVLRQSVESEVQPVTDTVNLGAGDDYLLGEAGEDTISGGSGSDILVGVLGNDILTGDYGADIFAWVDVENGAVDRIKDFTVDEDILDLSEVLEGLSLIHI